MQLVFGSFVDCYYSAVDLIPLLFRIECLSSGVADNINPVLSFDAYEGPLALTAMPNIDTRYITFDWPNQASIAIPEGIPTQNYGLYSCSTGSMALQHYIVECELYLGLWN